MKYILLVLVGIAHVGYSSDDIESGYQQCIDNSNGVTVNMLDCNTSTTAQWDNLLNKNYQVLMRILNKSQRQSLRTAQRSWLRYRDAELKFIVSTATGGTIDQLTHSSRQLELTKSRAIELYRYLEQFQHSL